MKMNLPSLDEVFELDKHTFMISIGNKDYKGFFSTIKADRETLPEGWYTYDLGEGDDGTICELKNGYICDNFHGTFCTQTVLPVVYGVSLYRDGYGHDFEYSFM